MPSKVSPYTAIRHVALILTWGTGANTNCNPLDKSERCRRKPSWGGLGHDVPMKAIFTNFHHTWGCRAAV